MNKEEKELLLKDLCARLPYGVKIYFGGIPKLLTSITIKTGYTEILVEGEYGEAAYCDFISTYNNTEHLQEEITEKCKPYLRLMSSMTDEEEDEYLDLIIPVDGGKGVIEEEKFSKVLNFYNSHHLDYNGLIHKGLALEAPEGMYND